MLLRSNFSSFPHYFIYTFLTSGVKLHIHLLNVAVQFIVFLTLSTLICRGSDISKCFSESLGIRDNGSRLYFLFRLFCGTAMVWILYYRRYILYSALFLSAVSAVFCFDNTRQEPPLLKKNITDSEHFNRPKF